MPRKKQRTSIYNQATSPQLFIRKIHSNKDLRKGLAAARLMTKPRYFQLIVKHLSRNSIYDALLVPMGYPMSLSDIAQKTRLQELTADGELMWCSSILAQHSETLSSFVKKRDKFYEAFLNADYDQAEKLIVEIQEEFGFSIWLIKNRLQLLQETRGLQAQKSFLEELVNINGNSGDIILNSGRINLNGI